MPSTWLRGIAVVGLGLTMAACAGSEPSGDVTRGRAPADAVQVVTQDMTFRPDEIEAAAGEELVVEVVNEDSMPHDFAVEELDLNTGVIEPGESAVARLEVPAGGVGFECTLHEGMQGLISAR